MSDQRFLAAGLPPAPFVPLEEAAERLGYAASDWRAAARRFPVRWPRQYLELAETAEGAPVRRMGTPDPAELGEDAGDLPDPVGERAAFPHPFVVRKHRDRALLLVSARCHFYCRFCFRRSFPDGAHQDPTRAELQGAMDYLRGEADLREVILSGGDPLTLSDGRLDEILAGLEAMPQVERLRVHTRAPIHQPSRVTPQLVDVLTRAKPLRVVVHCNVAAELTPAARGAVSSLIGRGIPVLDQSVLLAGVNDSPDALVALYRALASAGVKPYYLHHPDRAPGNASFRVTIPRGLALFAESCARAAAEPHPEYVIDVPDGSGKVPVASLEALGAGRWRAPNGYEFDDIPER